MTKIKTKDKPAMQRREWYLKGSNTKIVADLCGTAGAKGIYIKTNCEMSRSEANKIADTIRKATKFLRFNDRNCEICVDKDACPEVTEAKKIIATINQSKFQKFTESEGKEHPAIGGCDLHRYPSEETLDRIRNFDIFEHKVGGNSLDNLPQLIELIFRNWEYSDWGFIYHPDTGCLELHTAGWSGNESVIAALEETVGFWSMFWRKSTCGGHYWFKLFMFDETGKKIIPTFNLQNESSGNESSGIS